MGTSTSLLYYTLMHTKSSTCESLHTHTHTLRKDPSSSFYGLFSTSVGTECWKRLDHCADRTPLSAPAAPLQPAPVTVTALCNSFLWVQGCMNKFTNAKQEDSSLFFLLLFFSLLHINAAASAQSTHISHLHKGIVRRRSCCMCGNSQWKEHFRLWWQK